ncbi:MAG: Asp-tRNA(Asn)/Glu-tRNA(Gln) amidotransferase subunit GatB, partial [Patescibacteria group bacterium]
MQYKPTIGLEIHAELKTKTKMFCDCLNDPNERHPNVNVCPICAGHPGTLPNANRQAIEQVLKVGMALSGEIPQFSKFDRKNYFYPDLAKGYQISQYDLPLIFGGLLHSIRLRRIHLEEDTGRLQHSVDGKHSLVDYNRCSVPLMELVTEPDIKNAEQAVEFARELQLILRYLGVSDADMEKGQMRVEANVSLNMGTKVEVKNINSFRAVQGAIEY